MAGGVAGVAWLGDLALAGAAAAGGHDGDGFWGVLGLGGREGWWCYFPLFLFLELRVGLLLVLLLKEDGIVDVVAFALQPFWSWMVTGLVWLVSEADVVNRYALDPGALSFRWECNSGYRLGSYRPTQCSLMFLFSGAGVRATYVS